MKSAKSKKARATGPPRQPPGDTSLTKDNAAESNLSIAQEIRDLRAELNRLDRRQIKSAQERQAAGQTLSRSDSALLCRFKDVSEELVFLEKCRRIPQRIYRLLSGRQAKVLLEQATRHGLPFSGTCLDLAIIIRGFHDLLSRHRHRLSTDDSDEVLMRSGESPTLERWRLAKAQLAEIELEEKIGTILHINDVLVFVGTMADIVRRVGERLQRSYGQPAADVLNDGIDDLERIYELKYGSSMPNQPRTSVPHPEFLPPFTPGPICPRCGCRRENTPDVVQSDSAAAANSSDSIDPGRPK